MCTLRHRGLYLACLIIFIWTVLKCISDLRGLSQTNKQSNILGQRSSNSIRGVKERIHLRVECMQTVGAEKRQLNWLLKSAEILGGPPENYI